jgi:ComF family protein
MNKVLNDLLNFVYPPYCLICKESTHGGNIVCNSCFEKVHFINKNKCKICGKKIKSGSICKDCRKNPPFFDFVIGCGNYIPPLSNIIKIYKYNHRPSLSERLARMLYSLYQSRGDLKRIKVVSWIPMRRNELRERGYNQSKLLAEKLVNYANLKSAPLIKKVRNIPSQTKLPYEKRISNIINTYEVNDKYLELLNKDLEEGIILIDDVITTSSTMNECARVLREKGVKRIIGLVLAISS